MGYRIWFVGLLSLLAAPLAQAQVERGPFAPTPIRLTGTVVKAPATGSSPTFILTTPNLDKTGAAKAGIVTNWRVFAGTPLSISRASPDALKALQRGKTVTLIGYRREGDDCATHDTAVRNVCMFAVRQIVLSDTCAVFIGRNPQTTPMAILPLLPANEGLDATRCPNGG